MKFFRIFFNFLMIKNCFLSFFSILNLGLLATIVPLTIASLALPRCKMFNCVCFWREGFAWDIVFLHANHFVLMSVSVASLSECFSTVFARKWHGILVNSYMITEITKLRKPQRTHLALEDLIHPLGFWIVLVNDVVCIFVNNIVAWAVTMVFLFYRFWLWVEVNVILPSDGAIGKLELITETIGVVSGWSRWWHWTMTLSTMITRWVNWKIWVSVLLLVNLHQKALQLTYFFIRVLNLLKFLFILWHLWNLVWLKILFLKLAE